MCCDAKTIFCTVIELFVLYFVFYILRKIGGKVNTSVNHTEGTYKLTQFNFNREVQWNQNETSEMH